MPGRLISEESPVGRGDLNGDGLTEDSGFVIFVAGYDALVCP